MHPSYSIQQAGSILRGETGIVIPVYLPEGVNRSIGETLLEDTVAAYCDLADDPTAVCLCVDGEDCGADAAGRLAQRHHTSLSLTPINRGKFNAAAAGVRRLMERHEVSYIAVVDQDGDHFANELLNFIRAARHISHHTGSDRTLILGRRSSRHRPMGLLRGEMEELADRVLLDALHYRAAVTGRPLRLEYAYALEAFPDFHSGYKLFDRSTAQAVFLSEPQLAGVTETCYYRHGVEAVMVVEALEYGAYLGVVQRTTINEQPISTFGLYNRIQMMADKMIWPCKRLEIPLPFVRQWLDNHIPRLLLQTLAPQGKEELASIRQTVLQAMGDDAAGDEQGLHPLFV